MTYRKLLLVLALGALLLALLLLKFVPWEALITLLFLLGIMLSPVISQLLQIAKARLTPIPHYRPSPEQPPSKSTYEQGYQEQPPASSTSWSSYRTWGNDQTKQDPPGAFYDQPQVQSSEQAPPPNARLTPRRNILDVCGQCQMSKKRLRACKWGTIQVRLMHQPISSCWREHGAQTQAGSARAY